MKDFGDNMLFSIVIPVYNVEKYLNECVESILTQLESIENDCEILLIDDGSTDKSARICDDYASRFPRLIKVYHKRNEGLLLTRRYGFRKASGKYIVNCDSDDLIEPNMLRIVRDIIYKYDDPDIIIINYNKYNDVKKTIAFENIFTNEHACLVNKQDLLREFMLGHSVVSVCGKIVKNSCINIDMDYSEFGRLSTGEDTLQSIEFFSNAKTCVYLNEALYDYRCSSGMTAKFDANYYFTFKMIFGAIQKQRDNWRLSNFEELFAIKVLQTAGRAITQSRLKKWDSFLNHKKYLQEICKDDLLNDNMKYIGESMKYLQFDHYILLILLKRRLYSMIIVLLYCKNLLENKNK